MRAAALAAGMTLAALAGAAVAQGAAGRVAPFGSGFVLSQSDAILVVDREALWLRSAWGRRASADAETRRSSLAAENDRIAADLEAEDAALTQARKTLPPDEFRARADAFDARVVKLRTDRDAAGRQLVERLEAERAAFLRAALPVIGAAIEARGARILLDRELVFVASDAVDVTDALVAAVDGALGPGTPPPETPAGPQPQP